MTAANDIRVRRPFLAVAIGLMFVVGIIDPLASQGRPCLQELVQGFPDDGRSPIPVGCQLLGCCPGCPDSAALSWHVRVEGDLIDGALLTFDGVAPAAWQRLSVKGPGQARQGNQFYIPRGDTILIGFDATSDGRPPVAHPRLVINSAAVQKALGEVPQEQQQIYRDVGRAKMTVEQKLGEVVVNESVIDYVVSSCPDAAAGADIIELQSNDGNDNAVILVDGRRGTVEGPTACSSDEIKRAQAKASIGNVLSNFPFPPPICNQEVVVFSDDDAMAIRKVNFSNLPIDKVAVSLANLLRAPVTVWIMRAPFADTRTRAISDLARGNQLYNSMNCGVGLQTTAINNATADPDTNALLNATCNQAANLRSQIGFTAGQLNAYYLDNPGGARGWWCGGNTIIVGAGADNESLSHELGHSFSLGHTNDLPGFPATNLMMSGGTGRNNITEGQCFRCNVDDDSTLNTNGVRVGLTRNCPDKTTSSTCPASSLNTTTK